MRTRPRSQLRPRTGAAHSAPAHEKGESRPPRARATRLPSRAGPRDPYQNTRRVRHRHPHRQWPVAVARVPHTPAPAASAIPHAGAHGPPRRGGAHNRRARGALRIVVYEPATAVTPAWSGVFTCYMCRRLSGHAILCSQGKWGRGGQPRPLFPGTSPPSPGVRRTFHHPVGSGVPVGARPGFGSKDILLCHFT